VSGNLHAALEDHIRESALVVAKTVDLASKGGKHGVSVFRWTEQRLARNDVVLVIEAVVDPSVPFGQIVEHPIGHRRSEHPRT
jgi:hypothetical protein